MSMYECKHCGNDWGNFPGVMLAINDIPSYPNNHHENVFEIKFDEFIKESPPKKEGGTRYDYEEAWKAFYAWLGEEKMLWFCSKECAGTYLLSQFQEGE